MFVCLIIPESKKRIVARALGFDTLDQAIAAVKEMPLNEYGYSEIRKGGCFIHRTSNQRSYATILCGGGKCGMSRDWAAAEEYLTPRGQKLAKECV